MCEKRTLLSCFAHCPHSLATQYSLRLSRVCGRSLKEESLPLFVLFVLFGQAKSTLCFFVTFRTSEKYFVIYVLLHDQKYQKSSKTFPLRNLPVDSRFTKARSAPRLCQRTDFMHARHTFICGRGTSAYANLLGYFV